MFRGRIILMFLSLLLNYSTVSATDRDSIMAVLDTLSDQQRIVKYPELTFRYKNANPDLCIAIATRGINWALDKQELKLTCTLLHHLGEAYYIKGEYVLALDCYQRALNIAEKINDQPAIGATYVMMGQLAKKRKEYELAEKDFNMALNIFLKINYTEGLPSIYNFLGNMYEEWKGDKKAALQCYQKSLSYARQAGDSLSVSYSYDFMSGIYATEEKFDKSLDLLQDALEIRRAQKDDFSVAINLNNIGETYKLKGDLKNAEKYFLKSLSLSKEIDFKDLQLHTYTMLSEISSEQNNFRKAFEYMELRSAVKDSIITEKKNQQIIEMRQKYEAEKTELENIKLQKEAELSRQEAANLRNYFISAVIILMLAGLIGWLYVSQQQQRRLTRERIEQEQLRTRLIIEAEEKERIRIARELHDGVGQLLAAAKLNLSGVPWAQIPEKNVSNVSRLVDDAIKEVRSVSHSMMPDALLKQGLARAISDLVEKISSGTSMQIKLQLNGWEERWDKASESILYRVIQEILSNILKHSGASKVNIELSRFDDEISLIVEDDGKGFDPGALPRESGIGLKNMQSRISFLGGHMMIDSTPGRGTTTIIAIPITEKSSVL